MEQDTQGVYSRMYRSMIDHKQGLISFDEMLQHWKAEAKAIREAFQREQSKEEETKAA